MKVVYGVLMVYALLFGALFGQLAGLDKKKIDMPAEGLQYLTVGFPGINAKLDNGLVINDPKYVLVARGRTPIEAFALPEDVKKQHESPKGIKLGESKLGEKVKVEAKAEAPAKEEVTK